ncbi:unnamed protein product [Amoebophrya sp. A120]|nr:unnamed protein product [Amoebophrya sp. A120]|eukprot:GSA120T00007049001.1
MSGPGCQQRLTTVVERSLYRHMQREVRKFDFRKFKMPAIQELWGTGIYQQIEVHEKGLKRLVPVELRDYVNAKTLYTSNQMILDEQWSGASVRTSQQHGDASVFTTAGGEDVAAEAEVVTGADDEKSPSATSSTSIAADSTSATAPTSPVRERTTSSAGAAASATSHARDHVAESAGVEEEELSCATISNEQEEIHRVEGAADCEEGDLLADSEPKISATSTLSLSEDDDELHDRRPTRSQLRKDCIRWATDTHAAFEVLKALRQQSKLSECTSEKQTEGLLVEMVTGYAQEVSDEVRHIFSYNVRLTNLSKNKTYRVIARSLVFQNESGNITGSVRAKTKESMGIVGHTPVIAPGDQFLYGSGTTLNTKKGSMSGTFHIIEDKKRTKDFETRPLDERCSFFEHLRKTGKVGKEFHASFPITKCDSSVLSLDLPTLMLRNAESNSPSSAGAGAGENSSTSPGPRGGEGD